MSWLPDTVRWYATLMIVTWAIAPLTRWLCGRLPDKGATLGRPLALLVLVWPTWFLASISPIPFSTAGLWATALVVGVGGWVFAVREKWVTREWLQTLVLVEVVSLVIFLGYAGLRGYTPNITGTEKPMDVAFLSASARATNLPPADPWFSGETINYYYLGYFVHGSLSRMSSVPTWVAFNLALATTVSMAVVVAGGIAWSIGRALVSRSIALAVGVFGAFFVAVSGNLFSAKVFVSDPSGTINHAWWPYPDDGGIGWRASRVIIDHGSSQAETINEFPWFSFTLGDLHPHVTALPFALLALGLAINLGITLRRAVADTKSVYAMLAITGIAIGALYPLNSWDFPTYLVVALAAVFFTAGWSLTAIQRALVLILPSVIAWLPFTLKFVPFAGGDEANLPSSLQGLPLVSRFFTTVAGYTGERTSAGEFLQVFGITWAVAVIWLGVAVVQTVRSGNAQRISGLVITFVILVAILAVALPAPVLILAGAPLAASLWLIWRRWDEPLDAQTIAAGLFAAAFGLIVITEFFYIQDVFQGRYNTLFKVYYQVWSLLGIGAAVSLGLLWREVQTAARRVVWRPLLAGGTALALAAGLVYPVIASEQWTDWNGPREWYGLDGLAFIGDTAPGDEATIRWLSDHAQEGDIVLEAPGCQYQINFGIPTSRISAFTGVPTLIGQDGAEGQWRDQQPDLKNQINVRADDVAAMYADPESDLFATYGVTLMYVGGFERNGSGEQCEKGGPFPAVTEPNYPGSGWTVVFTSDDGTLYRRNSAG